MAPARSLAGVAALCVGSLAWQPHAMPRAPHRLDATRAVQVFASERERPLSREEALAAKDAAKAALEAADAKLEKLNEVGKAKSWGDMGLPPEPVAPPAVPAFVSAAPLVVGGFSVLLFTLNAVGLFGDGPDLDALVEEWSKL